MANAAFAATSVERLTVEALHIQKSYVFGIYDAFT